MGASFNFGFENIISSRLFEHEFLFANLVKMYGEKLQMERVLNQVYFKRINTIF